MPYTLKKPCKFCKVAMRHRGTRCYECSRLYTKSRYVASPKSWKSCGFCGKRFLGQARSKHCSKLCKRKFGDRKRWPCLPIAARECFECKKSFKPVTKWGKFCSQRCLDVERQRRRKKGTFEPEKRVVAVCQSCAKEFSQPQRYYSTLKSRKPLYCSLACAYKARRGEASPKYRGGSVTYRGAKWLQLAHEIRSRDENLCGICGKLPLTRRKHPVDHIVPFRLMEQWGLDPNQQANLLTLCALHHGQKAEPEDRLLRGDLVGFVAGLKRIGYPLSAVRAAFVVAELSTRSLD